MTFSGGAIAICAGPALGVLLWGSIGDIFGQRNTINVTLFLALVFTLIDTDMPTYVGILYCVDLPVFFTANNLILDGGVFLEYPSFKYYNLQ